VRGIDKKLKEEGKTVFGDLMTFEHLEYQ